MSFTCDIFSLNVILVEKQMSVLISFFCLKMVNSNCFPGDWIHIPNSYDTIGIPDGYCWVEGDNSASTLDSRSFGLIPLGLLQGRATHIVWPPQRVGKEQKMPEGRLGPY
ncbi:hypothetical protein MKX01_040312 [Papaver californicum]|nr:hypothetical protein MKX01_040312 [Papaver californicum]